MTVLYLENVSTLRLDGDACNGCRLCTIVCPREVFVMEGAKARIIEKDACIECGACALNCAAGALSVTAGVGCASGILNGLLGRKSACCSVESDGEPVCTSC